MEPIGKKTTIVCPKCKGLEISVPWDIHGANARGRLRQVFFSLWASYFIWVILWFFIENVLILFIPILVYIVVTFRLITDYFLNLRTFFCLVCGLRWRGRKN